MTDPVYRALVKAHGLIEKALANHDQVRADIEAIAAGRRSGDPGRSSSTISDPTPDAAARRARSDASAYESLANMILTLALELDKLRARHTRLDGQTAEVEWRRHRCEGVPGREHCEALAVKRRNIRDDLGVVTARELCSACISLYERRRRAGAA